MLINLKLLYIESTQIDHTKINAFNIQIHVYMCTNVPINVHNSMYNRLLSNLWSSLYLYIIQYTTDIFNYCSRLTYQWWIKEPQPWSEPPHRPRILARPTHRLPSIHPDGAPILQHSVSLLRPPAQSSLYTPHCLDLTCKDWPPVKRCLGNLLKHVYILLT